MPCEVDGRIFSDFRWTGVESGQNERHVRTKFALLYPPKEIAGLQVFRWGQNLAQHIMDGNLLNAHCVASSINECKEHCAVPLTNSKAICLNNIHLNKAYVRHISLSTFESKLARLC